MPRPPFLSRLGATLRACLRDRRAATAIEYGLLVALLALGTLLAVRTLADATVGQLNTVDVAVRNAG